MIKWELSEIGIFFNNNEEQLEFIKEQILPLGKGCSCVFHFFFEPNNEIRLRAEPCWIEPLEEYLKKKHITYTIRHYTDEVALYGKKGWEGAREFFHQATLTGLRVLYDEYENSKDFYAKRYVHLLLNCMNFDTNKETKFYLKMFIRYTHIWILMKLLGKEERVAKLLSPMDKIFGWD